MLNGKQIAVIFSGIFFCGLWLFFTGKVQEKQFSSNEKSVDLMVSLAEENLTKFFQTPLELEEASVKTPFVFLLTLDSATSEPKLFVQNKEFNFELSALAIKAAFKATGKSNKLFVFESDKVPNMPLVVRVFKGGEVTRLEGMPLRNLENAMSYAFLDQTWFVTDESGRLLVGSNKTQKRFTKLELNDAYVSRPVTFESYKAKIYVKKSSGFSVALANFFGVFGIGLIAFALFSQVSRVGRVVEKELFEQKFSDDKIDSLFEEEFEEDVQMVQLKKDAPAVPNEPEKNFVESAVKEESVKVEPAQSKVITASATELDYSDFLMENPILGEEPSVEPPSIKNRPDIVEESNLSREVNVQVKDEKVDFLETDEVELNDVAESEKANDAFSSVEAMESSTEDDWLRLAEELTDSLEEFAQNYDDKKADQVTKDLKV